MRIFVLLITILGWTGLTGAQAAGTGEIPEKQTGTSLAVKGKLLLEDDLRYPAEYTRDFQMLKEGWRVRAWHARWERTEDGLKSVWETGHNPVLAYECSLQDVVVEVDFRFSREADPANNAYCRVNLANLELDPKAYSVSTWINATVKNRPRGLVLEHEEWQPGGNTPVRTRIGNFLEPDTWHTVRLEVVGTSAMLSCNGVEVYGKHDKFGLEKKLLVIGVGKSRHEIRRVRVYEALPNPEFNMAEPGPQSAIPVNSLPERAPLDTTTLRKIAGMTPIFDGITLSGWVQDPVAPVTLAREDMVDPAGFINRLNARSCPVTAFLNEQLDSAARAGIAAFLSGNTDPRQTLSPLIRSINRILMTGTLYSPSRFHEVTLRAETKELLGRNRSNYEEGRLNRLLMEDAFPVELAGSPGVSWIVKDGALVSTGAGRGVIYTEKEYGNYRLIFQVRQTSGNHFPGVLLFGTKPPEGSPGLDALGGIQFAVPSGGHWDYRPGINRSGDHFRRPLRIRFDEREWAQVEILVNAGRGTARMAIAQPLGTRSVEVLWFGDPAAGKPAPVALQMHNPLLFDEYRNIRIETDPQEEKLITLD